MKRVLVVLPEMEKGGIANVVKNIYNSISVENIKTDFACFVKPSDEYIGILKNNGSDVFIIERFSKSGPYKHMKEIRKIYLGSWWS